MAASGSAISHLFALIDTGPSRNLISQQDYEALPQLVLLRPPGSLMLVARNNQEIHLFSWITLWFTISTRSVYHEFGVGRNLPTDMLIG